MTLSKPAARPGLLVVAAVSICLAACASEPPQGRGSRDRFDGRRADVRVRPPRCGGPALFISPAGEPYRAGADAPSPLAAWFTAADLDHDGRLTRQEFRQDAARFFHVLDVNGDGVIDGSEINRYEHVLAPEILSPLEQERGGAASENGERPAGGGRMGGGRRGGGRRGGGERSESSTSAQGRSGPPQQGAIPYGLIPLAEPVASADGDLDGKVTLAEFLAAADHRFGELDPAGAGALTLDGLPKTPIQGRTWKRGRKPNGD